MPRAWMPGEPEDDELERLLAGDSEAWRGDVHPSAEPWAEAAADDVWRGGEHLADWPEEAAGPEYHLLKGWIRRHENDA